MSIIKLSLKDLNYSESMLLHKKRGTIDFTNLCGVELLIGNYSIDIPPGEFTYPYPGEKVGLVFVHLEQEDTVFMSALRLDKKPNEVYHDVIVLQSSHIPTATVIQ